MKTTARLAFALLVLLVVGVSVFPLVYAGVTSLKTGTDLFSADMWGFRPVLDNYAAIFRQQSFGRAILNSLVVATLTVALALGLAVAAAYPLARQQFRGKRTLLLTFLAVSMFPQVAVLSGLFTLIRQLGLYNNLLGLVFAYMIFTLPFSVWVLTTFMRALPRELEEAAIVDGASPLDVVVRIFLPLLGPAAAATGLLAFIAAWNEFLFALTFTLSDHMRTVPVAIALMSGASAYELPWGQIMAASVVVTVPLVLLVLVFQRRIVAGLTAGAVKG